MLNIVTVPNKILTTPSQEIKKIDQSISDLVIDMEKTLIKRTDIYAVGLAAPQIGIGLAVFIMKPHKKAKTEAFINPRIIKHETKKTDNKEEAKHKRTKLEGCLSIPKIWAPVARAKKVLLEYQDVGGKQHKRWFSGFKAVIIQHEVDHLNGILYTQRALEQNATMYEEKEGKLNKLVY